MMLSAFLYLTARTAYNRVIRQIKRIRTPRYAIAVVVGGAYLWFFLFSHGGTTDGSGPLASFTRENVRGLISFAVFLFFAWGWIFGRRADALAFTPAEVHFLFPAPVSHRGLVVFKLLRLQVATLIGTMIWVLLLRRGSGDLHILLRALGLWVLFATLSMHRLGAALVYASILQHGVAGLRRQRIVSAILLIVAGLFAWAGYTAWGAVQATSTSGSFREIVQLVLAQPLLQALLEPFRILSQPAFAASNAEWVDAFPFALAIAAAHFIWVIGANTAFEEAAAEASARIAKRVADFRARGTRTAPPKSPRAIRGTRLPLSATGNPALAIVWKNGLAFLRSMRGTTIFIFIILASGLLTTLFVAANAAAAWAALISMTGMLLIWSVILGPRFVRNDLRADMAQLSLLKTYPLSSSSIVAAEVASATLALTLMQCALVLVVIIATLFENGLRLALHDRILIAIGAPIGLAAVNSVNLAIQNGASLLFPAWMSVGLHRQAGVEALGQNILLALASITLLGIALLPAVITGGLTSMLLGDLPMRARLVAAVLAGLVVIALELFGTMHLLGRIFERTDPSSVS